MFKHNRIYKYSKLLFSYFVRNRTRWRPTLERKALIKLCKFANSTTPKAVVHIKMADIVPTRHKVPGYGTLLGYKKQLKVTFITIIVLKF